MVIVEIDDNERLLVSVDAETVHIGRECRTERRPEWHADADAGVSFPREHLPTVWLALEIQAPEESGSPSKGGRT